jgi:hypothetical protein
MTIANGLDRSSFGGRLWDVDRAFTLVAEALDSDSLLATMSTIPTGRASVAFPYAAVDGAEWIPELGSLPAMEIGDEAPVVVPAKIGGKFLLSNESVDDADFPVAMFIRQAIGRSVVRKAAADLVYGVADNASAPVGVFDSLGHVEESTLRAGVVAAVASIARNYGRATDAVIAPELWEAEVNRREALGVPSAGATGLFDDLGIKTSISPALKETDCLVVDRSKVYKILRRDLTITSSDLTSEAWNSDGTSVRIIARLAAAIPRPTEAARSVKVGNS